MTIDQAPALKTAQTMMAKAKPASAAAAEEIMPEAVPVRDDGGEGGAKPKFAKSLTERIKSAK